MREGREARKTCKKNISTSCPSPFFFSPLRRFSAVLLDLGFGFGGRRCSIFLKAEAADAAREKKTCAAKSTVRGEKGQKNKEEKTQNTLDKTRSSPHTFLNLRRHSGGIGALFCCPFSPFCSRAPKIYRALKANWQEGE